MASYLRDIAAQFGNPVTAIAQILGFIPMIMGFFVFYFNDRRKALAVKALCDTMFVGHFFMLNQWSGGFVCIVNALRGVFFSQRGRYKWSSTLLLPVVFCLLTIGGSLLGWAGVKSLLPMAGSCIAVIGYWCNEPKYLRRLNFVGISLWLIYGIITLSVPTIIGNCVYLTSIIRTETVLFFKERRQRHRD